MSTKYKNSKDVPMEVLLERLDELADAVTGGKVSRDREFTIRIPAECDRDADLVISQAVIIIRELQAKVSELEAEQKSVSVPKVWKPISTAPMDGTQILLCTPTGKIADGMFSQRYKVWSWPYVMVDPTHWMQRPEPASQEKDHDE